MIIESKRTKRDLLNKIFTLDLVTIKHRLHRRLCEWHLAVVMMLSGLALMVGDTFLLEPFAVVRQIASQDTWAWTLFIVGFLRFGVLFVNGAIERGSPHLRSGLASISTLLWSVMLAGLLAFKTPLLIGPFLAAAVIFDLVNAFRAAQDARVEDEGGVVNGDSR